MYSEANFELGAVNSNLSLVEEMQSEQFYQQEGDILQKMEEMLETNPIAVYRVMKEILDP